MKASEFAKELIENIAIHGDGEMYLNSTGEKVAGIMHSDTENVPDVKLESWYEIIAG